MATEAEAKPKSAPKAKTTYPPIPDGCVQVRFVGTGITHANPFSTLVVNEKSKGLIKSYKAKIGKGHVIAVMDPQGLVKD